ncbi:hypothetical protein [Pseudooctadecabacter sp.]|uniref:hypothetical protein n=1 Tax=Pseudooctadecabacter sp. TaxID=1966338 RepID=UPI0035C8187F
MSFHGPVQNNLTQPKSFIIVSSNTDNTTQVIDKMRLISSDVSAFVVDDPRQLYSLNDYEIDGVIVSDPSADGAFANAAYRILREVSTEAILISEGHSLVDDNIASNINSQYDAFFDFGATIAEIQMAVTDALVKRSVKNRLTHLRRPQGRKTFRRLSLYSVPPAWQEFVFGLFWFLVYIKIASAIFERY